MKLRKLKLKDAPYMLEWMHDSSVVRYLRKDFTGKTLEDCIKFINHAQDEIESINLAIVDDCDEYIGTVSLKHIHQNQAELGIVIRSAAAGRGYSSFALKEIFDYGYRTHVIEQVYWCVDPQNTRAVRFYDMNDYQRCDAPYYTNGYTNEEKERYLWYCYRITEK